MPQYSLSRLLTVEETAEYLGMSSKTVDRHRRSGDITYVQKGRYVRIRFGDLLEAIARWTRKVTLPAESTRPKPGARVAETTQKTESNDRLTDVYSLALSLAADGDEAAPRRKKSSH